MFLIISRMISNIIKSINKFKSMQTHPNLRVSEQSPPFPISIRFYHIFFLLSINKQQYLTYYNHTSAFSIFLPDKLRSKAFNIFYAKLRIKCTVNCIGYSFCTAIYYYINILGRYNQALPVLTETASYSVLACIFQ